MTNEVGRTAVVTGAARGIGRAVAQRLAAAGTAVAVWDLDREGAEETASALQETGARVLAVTVDVTSYTAVEAAAAQTLSHFSRIDVLVNNAGIAGPSAPLWEQELADWRRVLDINLTGVFYCCRAVVPHMRQRGWGRIVNIASIAGKEGNPLASPYSAAKAGVIGLTKSLGKELAQDGILVNAVTPAVIETPILKQVTEEHVRYMVEKIPMKRTGQPEEVAALVAWLASDQCSFSTGAVFDISGGRATY